MLQVVSLFLIFTVAVKLTGTTAWSMFVMYHHYLLVVILVNMLGLV